MFAFNRWREKQQRKEKFSSLWKFIRTEEESQIDEGEVEKLNSALICLMPQNAIEAELGSIEKVFSEVFLVFPDTPGKHSEKGALWSKSFKLSWDFSGKTPSVSFSQTTFGFYNTAVA